MRRASPTGRRTRRIALVVHGPLSAIGGVERFNGYLLQALREDGFAVEVHDPSRASAPRWVRRRLGPLVQYYYVGREIARELHEYDLVITTGYTGGRLRGPNVLNISFGSVQSYFRSLRTAGAYNRRFVLTRCSSTVLDRLSKRGKSCVAISPQVQDELRSDYGVESVLVPCGVDTAHFSRRESGCELRSRCGIPQEATVGVFAGRWDPAQKGLEELIPIVRQRTDVHWILAPDKKLEFGGSGNVTVLHPIPYDALPDVYSAADFSVQLSRYESFGFAFVESLACSTPVISTSVGIARQLYADPLLGRMLVGPETGGRGDVRSQVHDRIDALKDPDLRARLARRGRERVEQECSLQVWQRRIRDVLAPWIEGPPCRS